MSFTYTQAKVLSIIPHVTGCFSVAGSSCIIYEVLSDFKTKWRKPYHRLLFGMACYDVVCSIAFGLSTWPIPRGSPGVYAPLGTVGTCTAQGFFVQASIAVPLYNLCLSIYYLLKVKFSVNERIIRRKYETWMHVFIMFLAFGTAFVGLGMGWYHDSTLWCWFNGSPKGCKQSWRNDGVTTCEQGDNTQIFRWAFYYAWLWFAIAGTMLNMFLLWRAVKKEEKNSVRWTMNYMSASQFGGGIPYRQGSGASSRSSLQFVMSSIRRLGSARPSLDADADADAEGDGELDSEFADNTAAAPSSSAPNRRAASQGQSKNRLSNMVMWQAFRYVLAFWLTWLFGSLNRLLQLAGYNIFWVMVLHSFFVPMQGFFNFLVYKYPRFYRWRKKRQKAKKTRSSGGVIITDDEGTGAASGSHGAKLSNGGASNDESRKSDDVFIEDETRTHS